MINMFSFLATPLAYIMRFIYDFVMNYGWTIIIFTVLVRILLIPLSLLQQKSTARMGAYQPLIQEIQKKWANDKNRQTQEVQKFYTENNIKMTGGCLPMMANMLVLFGIIGVIQAPLQYMVGMPQDQINNAIVILAENREEIQADGRSNYTIQSIIIGEIKNEPELFLEGTTNEEGELVKVEAEWVNKVQEFNFDFLGLNLAERPTMNFNQYLIMPILSILTMFASQLIIMKTSGTAGAQGKNTMLVMTLAMGLMFGFFAFTVPVGFSLYYTVSNVVMTGQQLLLKKIYDPKKIQEQIIQDIEAKKLEKKAKKVVTVKNKEGAIIQKEMSDSEIARLRLEKARQMDIEKYSDKATENSTEEAIDEVKSKTDKNEKNTQKIEKNEDNDGEEAKVIRQKTEEKSESDEGDEYKPGRRKRARMKKEDGITDEGSSFAEDEMKNEQRQKSEEDA